MPRSDSCVLFPPGRGLGHATMTDWNFRFAVFWAFSLGWGSRGTPVALRYHGPCRGSVVAHLHCCCIGPLRGRVGFQVKYSFSFRLLNSDVHAGECCWFSRRWASFGRPFLLIESLALGLQHFEDRSLCALLWPRRYCSGLSFFSYIGLVVVKIRLCITTLSRAPPGSLDARWIHHAAGNWVCFYFPSLLVTVAVQWAVFPASLYGV